MPSTKPKTLSSRPAWYHVKHRGPAVQRLWQMAIGSSLLFVFVVIPATYDYMKSHSRTSRPGMLNFGRNPMQEAVFKKRLEWRNGTPKS